MTAEELFFEMNRKRQADVLRTPGPGCPYCIFWRQHPAGQDTFHPYKGHGYATGKMGGGGAWTHPELVPKELVKVGK